MVEKRAAPIAFLWMSFHKQTGMSNSVTNSTAFAEFLLLKEQI